MTAARRVILLGLLLAQDSLAQPAAWQLTLTGSGEERANDSATANNRDSALHLHFRPAAPSSWQGGYQHRYRVVNLPQQDGIRADSNGHLHHSGPWLSYQASDWQLTLAPQLAVSSNLLRHPNQLQEHDLQLHGQWLRQSEALRWGISLDNRLGRYLPYPHIHWHGQGPTAFSWQLGWPDNAVHWQADGQWRLQLSAGPDGGQWQVRDGQLERRSQLRQQRLRLGPSLHWQPLSAVTLTLGADYLFAQRIDYQLENGQHARIRPADGQRVWLALQLGSR